VDEKLKELVGSLQQYADQLPFPVWWLLVGTVLVLWAGYLIKCRWGKS
jgi:hypothetical protein